MPLAVDDGVVDLLDRDILETGLVAFSLEQHRHVLVPVGQVAALQQRGPVPTVFSQTLLFFQDSHLVCLLLIVKFVEHVVLFVAGEGLSVLQLQQVVVPFLLDAAGQVVEHRVHALEVELLVQVRHVLLRHHGRVQFLLATNIRGLGTL